VDAIVRPQLTNQISIQSPVITIQLSVVVFVQQEKFLKKFGDEGVGPPSPTQIRPYPPSELRPKDNGGGVVNANQYHLHGQKGKGKGEAKGSYHFKPR
jgi:hypothetical protein